jgi:hypothetical protein
MSTTQLAGYEDIIYGRTAPGNEALVMRVWHIVETPLGGLAQDPKWGWGLPSKLGSKTTGDLRTEANIGRTAIRRDREVRDATVTITEVSAGRYRVEISISPLVGDDIVLTKEITSA